VCWGIMILCDGKRLKFKLLTDEAFLFKFMAWEATPTRVMVGMRIGYPYMSVRNVVPTLTSNKRRGLSLNGRC
jgi:hypothetical protein